MEIVFLWVGKTDNKQMREILEDYIGRIERYVDTRILEAGREEAKKYSREHIVKREGKNILDRIDADDSVVALDSKGESYSSSGFASLLAKCRNSGMKRLVFVAGGEYGLSRNVLERAQMVVSLSRMTFPHNLVRIILAEQIYRAFNIIRGTDYHK